MKTRIATFFVVLGILFTTIASANEPVPASKAVSKSVADLIKSELEFPDFARETDFYCCVLVRVTILPNGRFDVDCINCMNEQLKQYVIGEIESIVSEKHASFAGQTVSLKVNFKCI
jgi:hypothetical protein